MTGIQLIIIIVFIIISEIGMYYLELHAKYQLYE